MKYNAFISYSHAVDGKLAPALQKTLHRLAKPWYKQKVLNVFRDGTNLSATPHLWNNIESALGQSEYLVLLASSKAAQSKWVTKEVSYCCLLYTSPSPRDATLSRMPSSA